MNFFSRLSNGFTIFKNSFSVLKENKQLILFPILSGVSLLLVMLSFLVSIMASAGWDVEGIDVENNLVWYALLFGFYVVNYFIIVFFNMALVHCTHLYFQGQEVSIKVGIQYSLSRFGAILTWALLAATVGTILKIIQEEAGFLGKIIAGIFGAAWNIATFFVVPIIAYEEANPFTAIKRSTQLMKDKWGESLAGTFSFGLVQFLGIIVIGLPLYFIGSFIHPVAGIALAIAGGFIVISVISAAQTIFISAVYHNVTGDPVEQFNQQMIDNLFETK